jgi:hypothetical protein
MATRTVRDGDSEAHRRRASIGQGLKALNVIAAWPGAVSAGASSNTLEALQKLSKSPWGFAVSDPGCFQ